MIAVAPRHVAIHDHEVMEASIRRGHALITVTGKPYLAAKRLEEEAGEPSMERVIFDHQDPDGRNAVRYPLTIRRGRTGLTHGDHPIELLLHVHREGRASLRARFGCNQIAGDRWVTWCRWGLRSAKALGPHKERSRFPAVLL